MGCHIARLPMIIPQSNFTMKKILFTGLLLAALNASAQESPLMNREFWQSKPNVETVKTELKGYNFAEAGKGDDPLSLAISNDAPIEVIKFLASQPGVNFKKDVHEARTYLHSAASKGNAEACDVLIKQGSDIYYLDAHDQTALTYAAFMGSLTLPVLQAFEKNGLDIKKKYPTKNNADIMLLGIGSDKDLSITNYLMGKGLSLNTVDKQGNSIFNYAAKYGHVPTLQKLIEKGVKPANKDLLSAAQGPFRGANKIDVFQYLVEEVKLVPTATNDAGQNVLHIIAAKANQDDIITYFVNKGVNINQVDKEGNTPFMNVCGTKGTTIVELMLPKVKSINTVNKKGESALLNAVKGSTGDVVTLLIDKGADVRVTDKEGKTLGYYLVEGYQGQGGRGGFGGGGRGGAQPNAGGGFGGGGRSGAAQPNAGGGRGGRGGAQQAANGASPAEDFGKKLKALQSKGLNLSAPQKDGNTLYHLAVAKNDLSVVKQLDGLNIDINAKNKEGITALHKAAMVAKNDAILKYLVSIGAKKDAVTSVNESAYDLAKENEFLTQANVSVDFLK